MRHETQTTNLETRQPHLLLSMCTVLRVQDFTTCMIKCAAEGAFEKVITKILTKDYTKISNQKNQTTKQV